MKAMNRAVMGVVAIGVAGLLGLAGCRAGGRISGDNPPAVKSSFEAIKGLSGTWETKDEKGQTVVGSVFAVTAGGSAVREIMFPGTDHEMTNMYHMDGDALVATHYCAAGNQPRMRCERAAGGVYAFTFADVTNLKSADTEHMAELRLVMVDKDHLRQEWQSFKDGKKTEHVTFELTRKK